MLKTVLEQALNLSPLEKVRLVERVMASLERDLTASPDIPRRRLRGIWSDVNVSSEDIDEARREMWGNSALHTE